MNKHTSDAVDGGGPQVRLAPAGTWAELEPFVRPHDPTDGQVDGGRCFWLSDTQIDLSAEERVWLSRTISEVTSSDGLQDAGQVNIDFDPTYERIVFHHVRVIRDGASREVDPIAGLSVFRRERDLERARYDGHLTAHLVIPDVRVGDVIDVAYSNLGSPPIFGDVFSAEWSFSWGCWVGETRVRILSAADKELIAQGWNDAPEVQIRQLDDGLLERTWRTVDAPQVPGEPDAASWVRRVKRVKVCTPISWRGVADTFRDLYATEALPEDLDAEVAALEAEIPDAAERATSLLRKVQSSLRYQAVSIGDGGFAPAPIKRIWALRAGDCKDASRLLVALMRRVGLDASPALVSTGSGWALRDEAPSLNVFNHCIVRLRLDGRDYWLDPTSYRQGGRLDVLHQARFGWALPLVADSDLVFMGEEPVRDVFRVDETYQLGDTPTDPAELTVTTTYGAWRADAVRRSLESDPAGLARGYVEFYARYYGDVSELQPLEVQDDLDANEVRITERYRLAQAWNPLPEGGAVEFIPFDDLFSQQLTTTRTSGRRWPIDLGLPRALSWTTKVRLPVAVKVTEWDHNFDIPGIKLRTRHSQLDDQGYVVGLHRTARFERQFLPAEEAGGYFDLRDAALRASGLTITVGVSDGRFLPAETAGAPPKPSWRDWFSNPNVWRVAWLIIWASAFLVARLLHHQASS